jgi:hypothetical protein
MLKRCTLIAFVVAMTMNVAKAETHTPSAVWYPALLKVYTTRCEEGRQDVTLLAILDLLRKEISESDYYNSLRIALAGWSATLPERLPLLCYTMDAAAEEIKVHWLLGDLNELFSQLDNLSDAERTRLAVEAYNKFRK